MRTILVTGAAGFIGYHLSERLLGQGDRVVGVDNLNSYYDVSLKKARLERLRRHDGFRFVKMDISNSEDMENLFGRRRGVFDRVVHLAAQAGVRYSIKNPHAYVDSNVKGFLNILEGCRYTETPHLVFASSSSVYGGNAATPFSVHHNVDHPVSLYAATKKAGELMAHAYADLYGIPCTGLRFFTVYGPWGRPDMALFLFTKAILEERPIDVYNRGNMRRDFTYIDDIIEGVARVMELIPVPDPRWDKFRPDPGSSFASYRIYNIGNNRPVLLEHFINLLEDCLGRRAKKNMLPLQPGDVVETCADVDDLMRDTGFRPTIPVEEGIKRFVDWYGSYYGR